MNCPICGRPMREFNASTLQCEPCNVWQSRQGAEIKPKQPVRLPKCN